MTYCSMTPETNLQYNISLDLVSRFTKKIATKLHLSSFPVKFIYSEKAMKFCKIFPLLLTVCTVVKNKGKISQNFVAFSEYMNFKTHVFHCFAYFCLSNLLVFFQLIFLLAFDISYKVLKNNSSKILAKHFFNYEWTLNRNI